MTRSGLWAKPGVVAVLLSMGCGTVMNVSSPGSPAFIVGQKKVYGGVRNDAAFGVMALKGVSSNSGDVGGMAASIGLALLATADLPLSAVADTVTLPITIPASLKDDSSKQPPLPSVQPDLGNADKPLGGD